MGSPVWRGCTRRMQCDHTPGIRPQRVDFAKHLGIRVRRFPKSVSRQRATLLAKKTRLGFSRPIPPRRNSRIRRGTGRCSDLKELLRDLQNRAPLLRIRVEHAKRGKQAGWGHANATALSVTLDHSDPEASIPLFRSLRQLELHSGVLCIASRRSC
jgi:hypothetical protein